jgi:sugar lactone lactonase YvrE
MKRILTIVLLLCLAAPAAAGGRFPDTIPLPNGWQPEGIATGKGNAFYSGSRATGAVYKGDLRTGLGDVLVQPWGGAALGMKVDHRNRLFVAGGGTGTASVYDARSGELLKRYTLTTAPTFVNDVIVTKRGAYFTDSLKRQLYVLDLGHRGHHGRHGHHARHDRLPAEARTLPLKGDLLTAPTGGFELNGIESAGRRLVAVHSALGRLYAIDPRDGDTDQIELDGGNVMNGDGLLRHGRTLYVVQNQLNRIAVVRLDRDLDDGEITGHLTDSDFDVPTTIAKKGGFLWAVNARFSTPPTSDTTYNVVKVSR